MQVREIMTPNPEVVTPDAPVHRAATIMRDLEVGIVPVVDGKDSRKLRGVITDRDITVRHVAQGHGKECPVSEDMSSDGITAKPEDEVEQLMATMRREQIRRIPVVDDQGQLVGIVAQADLAVDTGPGLEPEVEETVEQVSKPAEPQR